MNLPLLIVLGLASAVNARNCLTPNPVENFDTKKFEGNWYSVAIHVANKSDEALYEGDTCYVGNFKTVENETDVKINYLKKGTPKEVIGRLAQSDKTKALFNATFNIPVFANPTYTIICTDYTNYGVIYTGLQHEEGKCTEFALIVSRDRTKFAEVTSNDDVKKCIQDELKTSVDQFKPIVQTDC